VPNNREWALFIWAAVFIGWMMFQPGIRTSVGQMITIAKHPKIVIPLMGMIAWIGGEVWLGARWSLWTRTLTTDTAVWVVTAGLLLFGRYNHALTRPHFVRHRVVECLTVTALLEGYVALFPFALWMELIIQPVIAVIAILSAFAQAREQYVPIRKAPSFLLFAFGVTLLLYVTVTLVATWHDADKPDLLRQLALPVWLTVGLLPYVYFVALYAGYESVFLRLDWKPTSSRGVRLRNKLTLLLGLRFNARAIGSFGGAWPDRLSSVSSFREGRQVVKDFHSSLKALRSRPDD
jgi:hypothetical protein